MNNELSEMIVEKTITTKELAESLGVDVKTIQRASSKLFDPSTLMSRVINGGKSQVFTKEQATAIKIELQNHSKVAKNGYNTLTISNDLEMLLIQQKLNDYQTMRIAELEAANKTMLPKADFYDKYCDSTNLSEIGLLGEKTNIGKQNIFKILKADKVIQEKFVDGIKYYEAYYRYEKYFKSIPCPFTTPDGIIRNRDKLMLTQEGMTFFVNKYGK